MMADTCPDFIMDQILYGLTYQLPYARKHAKKEVMRGNTVRVSAPYIYSQAVDSPGFVVLARSVSNN